jgi:hypothetical protein
MNSMLAGSGALVVSGSNITLVAAAGKLHRAWMQEHVLNCQAWNFLLGILPSITIISTTIRMDRVAGQNGLLKPIPCVTVEHVKAFELILRLLY